MTELLTPEQIAGIRERDDGAASAASEGAPVGQTAIDRHTLLRDREANVEIDAACPQYVRAWAAKLDKEIRAFLTTHNAQEGKGNG